MFRRFPLMSCQSFLPLPIVRAIVSGLAYPGLRLLECLTSRADGLTYYAVC